MIHLREVIESSRFQESGSKLTFADLLSAAGVSQRVQSVEYHGRKRTGVIPAGGHCVVVRQRPSFIV